MKKKIIATIFGITAIGAAFVGGTIVAKKAEPAIPENYINIESIVDWNTNGEEISIMLEDDIEVYAYKSKNIYDNNYNHFPVIAEITGWEETDTGILLTTADGNEYYLEK